MCHTEYDTVVETSYVSECSDVVNIQCILSLYHWFQGMECVILTKIHQVTQECTQTSTSVFPSTSVVIVILITTITIITITTTTIIINIIAA